MKFNFQKVLPKARMCKLVSNVRRWKVKNVQSREVMHMLKSAGFKVEGELSYENNTTYGMVKGDEHILVTDTGKYPYRLGDTAITLGVCTTFYDAPINLR